MPCENSARKRSKTMAFRCTPEEHKLIGFVGHSRTPPFLLGFLTA